MEPSSQLDFSLFSSCSVVFPYPAFKFISILFSARACKSGISPPTTQVMPFDSIRAQQSWLSKFLPIPFRMTVISNPTLTGD
jgi:hypothetical protein